jgi:hypothetical protein
MPFKSEAQRKFLFSQKPSIARSFAEKTPRGANLPERIAVKKERKLAAMKAALKEKE